jgi:hypothetical protein
MPGRRRKGRVEIGLDRNLSDRPDIAPASRAALRALAHAVDLAEADRSAGLIAEAGRVYLDALDRNGLAAGDRPVDAFEQLLADLGRAGAGTGDPPPTGAGDARAGGGSAG